MRKKGNIIKKAVSGGLALGLSVQGAFGYPLMLNQVSFTPISASMTQETAEVSSALVELNGAEVALPLYAVNGFNLCRLSDLSVLLRDTENEFSYIFNETTWRVELETEGEFDLGEGEMSSYPNEGQNAVLQEHIKLYCNGEYIETDIYRIDGELYFMVSHLSGVLDLRLGWVQERGVISIETRDYVAPEPPPTMLQEDVFYLPVALYHSITASEINYATDIISVSQMRQDLQYLKDNGYTPVFMSELIDFVYHDGLLPEKPILLTFDDGYVDNYTLLFPLLQEFEMKAVVSLITSAIEYSGSNMLSFYDVMEKKEEVAEEVPEMTDESEELEESEVTEEVLSAYVDTSDVYNPDNWNSYEEYKEWYQWNAENDENWERKVGARTTFLEELVGIEVVELIEDIDFENIETYEPDVGADSDVRVEGFLDEVQIKEMYESGLVEFQCHTFDFHFSDNREGSLRLFYENIYTYRSLFSRDLEISATVFEQLGLPVATAFSYPGGKIDYENAQIVEEAGYVANFLTWPQYQNKVARADFNSLKYLTRGNRESGFTTEGYFENLIYYAGEHSSPNQFQIQYGYLSQ